ncbi:MAG: hypothetical protein C5B59_12365 [Bacteroidetes bacterium]|nr:MAG: hypothetical protein C5B59_12365 [Bacteroidota bacterium]
MTANGSNDATVRTAERELSLRSLFDLIRAWIFSESGPTQMSVFIPALKLHITIRGYKKIILERDFSRE